MPVLQQIGVTIPLSLTIFCSPKTLTLYQPFSTLTEKLHFAKTQLFQQIFNNFFNNFFNTFYQFLRNFFNIIVTISQRFPCINTDETQLYMENASFTAKWPAIPLSFTSFFIQQTLSLCTLFSTFTKTNQFANAARFFDYKRYTPIYTIFLHYYNIFLIFTLNIDTTILYLFTPGCLHSHLALQPYIILLALLLSLYYYFLTLPI